MKFVDEVAIYIRSGKGGDGCVSFLRAKFKPKGGPDGGDGGRGGSVIFEADGGLWTLLDFRYNQHYRAENGTPGMGRHKNGPAGGDCVVRVPVGTVVTDHETDEPLADLDFAGKRVVVARGGRGGRGNMHFATSTNQAPRQFEPGGPTEERRVRLTLKLMADVGLVGFPNAGKSTLISRISAARPKIADYPFTTLAPNLGLVRSAEERSFVVADIPGLIAGASEGAGLGHRFLKHVERVALLAFVLSPSWEEGRDPVRDYETLLGELEAYDPGLLEKPRALILAKTDLPETLEHREAIEALAAREGAPCFAVSAVRGDGLPELLYGLQAEVDRFRAAARTEAEPAVEGAEEDLQTEEAPGEGSDDARAP